MTLYAGSPNLLTLLLLAPAALIYILPSSSELPQRRKPKTPAKPKANASSNQLSDLPLKPFLTAYRGSMLIGTCVAILAVDFRLFPRRFGKVETWGTSLMDMGVGAFVFSGGVVAARSVLKEKISGQSMPVVRRILSSFRHSIPLLVLGSIRLLSVKGLEYAEHVTEYGVHWNFFFTLAFLPPFVAACQGASRFVPSFALLALIVGGGYEVLLEMTELKAFVLTAPRTDLISKNREGICSFFGYLAIFLAGQDLGMLVIPRNVTSSQSSTPASQRRSLLIKLGTWSAIWTLSYLVSTSYSYGLNLTVSRRLANLPYVLWVSAFSTAQMFVSCVLDTVFFPSTYTATDAEAEKEAYDTATSRVLRAYNRNGLAVFLLANLMTGLVNMTFRTLDAGQIVTMAILVGYTLSLTIVAVALDLYNISIKL